MKFIKYTYVDYTTGVPVSQQPAQTGPTHPEGVTPTYAIESTYSSGVPTFYGIAEDDFEKEEWMVELEEEVFFSTLKEELKTRARDKRVSVEQGGAVLGNQVIRTDLTSQNRVGSLVTALNNDPEMLHIDFEAQPGVWVELDRDSGFLIGKVVARHVQSCFSWCKSIHEQIDNLNLSLETMGDVIPILEAINSFGVDESEWGEGNEEPEEPENPPNGEEGEGGGEIEE